MLILLKNCGKLLGKVGADINLPMSAPGVGCVCYGVR